MKDNRKRHFHFLNFRWLMLVDTMIVTASSMSYGLVTTLFLDLGRQNAISMLYMIPPMTVAVALSSAIALRSIRKRMEKLLTGIQQVTDGDLTVELKSTRAGEYSVIYSNFNRMVRELKHTKEEMQNFVNEFSHEFKTPITSISGFSQYLLDTGEGIESPERMQYLQVIASESLRLSELSQNTLLLSKVEACEIITDKEQYDLSEQIKRCTILLLPQIEKKRIELELDLPDMDYCGNPEWMEQVWINLLSNAVKFTPEGGEIAISGAVLPDSLVIQVSDTGIGMDEETRIHIFEKYYQNDTIHSIRGNGIGLSIVHRIVTLCGGTVQVDSIPGEGSRFTIRLPR